MADLDYCFSALPDFEQIQCARWLKGGISGLILYETEATIADFTVLANWTTLINNGDATKLLNISGEFPDGSPVEGDNPIGCGSDTVVDGFDFVLNVMDSNVTANNDTYWAGINGQTYYMAVYHCENSQLWIVTQPVTVVAIPANTPKSRKEKQRYNVQLKWSTDKDWYPTRITSPTGLF